VTRPFAHAQGDSLIVGAGGFCRLLAGRGRTSQLEAGVSQFVIGGGVFALLLHSQIDFVFAGPLHILQVSTVDIRGGAEKVAWNLFHSFRARGYGSWLAVRDKCSHDPDVVLIPNREMRGRWSRFWYGVNSQLQSLEGSVHGIWRLGRLVQGLADPARWLDERRGVEDFRYPGTWRLLGLSPKLPKIVHLHNLHGNYFDLRALPWLSRQVPVVLTLHDAWLLSGHCAHSFDCERWKMGCGDCPDLTIYPAVQKDATAYNWQRKREIFAKSRLYLSTPCRWLMKKVEQSILAPAIAEARIIPYGVDLGVFNPSDRDGVRALLGVSTDTKMLVFTAKEIRRNAFKDYETMRGAIARVADRLYGQNLLLVALGEDGPAERIGRASVRFVPYQKDPKVVARYYQASDVYVHAARADTFPNTVLEALACGTPVVATAVGGIPEQVKSLDQLGRRVEAGTYGAHGATGILTPVGDVDALADGIERLLSDESLRRKLGENAAKDARERFDLERQVDSYLEWYEELLCHNFAPSTNLIVD
ncbi:MAG: glycosyltransferase, partial [Candidatus Binatia bacterium]